MKNLYRAIVWGIAVLVSPLFSRGDLVISGQSVLNASRTIIVDGSKGNDATGAREVLDKPFATITAAKAAAVTLDKIVVRPGTYTERNLLRSDIRLDYHFESGAIVSASGASTVGIFDDSSAGANGAVTSKITGHGRFVYASTTSNIAIFTGAFNITNASSNISFECDEIENASANVSTSIACVMHRNGTLRGKARKIFSSDTGTAAASALAVWWERGTGFIEAEEVYAAGQGWPFYTDCPTGSSDEFWLRARHIYSNSTNPVYCLGDPDARVWVVAEEITQRNAAATGAVFFGGPRMYVNAQKIAAVTAGGGPSEAIAGISHGWVYASKISGHVTFTGADPIRLEITCQTFESPDSTAITISGSSMTLNGGRIINGKIIPGEDSIYNNLFVENSANAGTIPVLDESFAGGEVYTFNNCDFNAESSTVSISMPDGGSLGGRFRNCRISTTIEVSASPAVISGVFFGLSGNPFDYTQVQASGTAYSLTATPAFLNFGTTDPQVTLSQPGVWLITARVRLNYTGATFAANRTVTLKLRKTSGSAEDVTGGSVTATTGVTTTVTGTFVTQTWTIPYISVDSSATIQLWGDVSVIPSAGSLDATEASIVAIRMQ